MRRKYECEQRGESDVKRNRTRKQITRQSSIPQMKEFVDRQCLKENNVQVVYDVRKQVHFKTIECC